MNLSEWIEIGTIVAAQGLNGEVKIYPNSDFPERFLEPGTRWILQPGQPQPQPIEFLGGRYIPQKGLYVVQLAEINTRTEAEALQGSQLFVPEKERPPLENDEFYVPDLIGLEVFHQLSGELIGTVINVIPAGNYLLEVEITSPVHGVDPVAEIPEIPPHPEPKNHPDQRKSKQPKIRNKPPQPTTVLIPFVMEIVPLVDLEKRRIEVMPPSGLLELAGEN